ncbi:unnamed protein product [Rhodiola kirilowii]
MVRRGLQSLRQLISLYNIDRLRAKTVMYMPRSGDVAPRVVTLIDGTNPLVIGAVKQVMKAMHVPVYFEKFGIHGDMKSFPSEVMESIKKNKVCLEGGLTTETSADDLPSPDHSFRIFDWGAFRLKCVAITNKICNSHYD